MTGKFLSLTALCLFSILTLTGATLDGDFVRGSNLRLLHGAELKNGELILKGNQSHAELIGSENFKVGKNGLTVTCVAAFDQIRDLGQDLFWKKECASTTA